MGIRNVSSTLLAVLLVFNASCACASKVTAAPDVQAHEHAHAHHHDSAGVTPDGDCPHPDCPQQCKAAAGVAASKDAVKPTAFKFDFDDIEWSAIDVGPVLPGAAPGATGPPSSQSSQAASTPVQRFDLQLE